jgi:oxygen-independent coproporphyrinogen-3 oxidase
VAGIYIHIPFCKSRCKYCDFFSTTHLEKQAQYVEALLAEGQIRQHEVSEPVYTLYIGGGTPSTVESGMMERIVQSCLKWFKVVQDDSIEITIEANPGDITTEKAQAWRAMGINRLSMGIQSFDDGLLQLIGRRHTAEQARQAVAIAQAAGFDNISIDLMYALPSQTIEQWKHDVAEALQLGVQHISTYGLIYEEGTILTTLVEHGVVEAVDEDTELQMYDYLAEKLTANGYEPYEVSNFALPNRQSKHNSNYWNDTPYIGFGAGAHSYNGKERVWNISDIDAYIEQAMAHYLQPEKETLSETDRHTERVMLGLRTSKGISIDEIPMSKALPYVQQGLLQEKGQHIVATTKGYHILNRIIEDLI